MAAWNGAAWFGTFASREEADRAADAAWSERVVTDEDGRTQWA